MPIQLTPPPKLAPGDRVAVVSPSFAAPAAAPAIHEQAMRRIRDELGLEPVEYPTTRRLGASAVDRAADLTAAFTDPSIRAVMATVGGDDQLTVLPHLDPGLLLTDPKPYFGYSDNTNLLNWLWFHGAAAYHGGSTQVQLGRGPAPMPVSLASLRAALFERADVEVTPVADFVEDELEWTDERALTEFPPALPAEPWTWHNADRVVTAPTWGGNLEILSWTLAVSRFVRPVADYAGCVLLLETSEEMPPAQEVFWMLRNAGERGLLAQFPAVLFGRAKAATRFDVRTRDERTRYRAEQQAAVLRAFEAYNPSAMIVFGVDFGHTEPQWVLPYGGRTTVDGPARRVVAHY
ncbi:LD-carboxypeptidase [uncultured Jatrophihabitans sp.]|uniref:S66 peptidase family protein n=1 Tax=uncultured Jatrophihabitans sp. TaxID=1610747 RepID=UPI0035CA8C64